MATTQDHELDIVSGTLLHIVWAERGRIIAQFRVDQVNQKGQWPVKQSEVVVVLGAMSEPATGQAYKLFGLLGPNPRFGGTKMDFASYTTILPSSEDGIRRYLARTAKWVGPSTAEKLTDAFGGDTLDVIRTDPDRVAREVAGITRERAGEMAEALCKNLENEAAAVEVGGLLGGVLPPAVTSRAIAKWGSDAPWRIKRNPFVLIQLRGVGFAGADAVYAKLGGNPNSRKRHALAITHVLNEQAASAGHTIADESCLATHARRYVGELRSDAVRFANRAAMVRWHAGSLQLSRLADAERYIESKIQDLVSQDVAAGDWTQQIDTGSLSEDQRAAVEQFRKNNLFILTGAPGTGKTYTTARIVAAMKSGPVSMCAPTGKAAKQMSLAIQDICPVAAMTIHTLLQPSFDDETGEFYFERGLDCPLNADLIVVDEFSMVDTSLACSLLKAIKSSTRVLIVGDRYQLPSVGPGAVLRDLIAAGVPNYELTQIQRNAGRIVRACHDIKDGRRPQPNPGPVDLEVGDNWRHFELSEPADILAAVSTLLTDSLPAMGYDRLRDVQIISPVNEKGSMSCLAINSHVKGLLNPADVQKSKLPFTKGDKVVRTLNGLAEGFYLDDDCKIVAHGKAIRIVNGDIGFVKSIEPRRVLVELLYPSRLVALPRSEHKLKLAYCLTCHKMQGSECPVLILPLVPAFRNMPMVTREWLYTAMSRPKAILITLGSLSVIDPIIRNVGMSDRRTGLQGFRRIE